jgi:hypothetical protein
VQALKRSDVALLQKLATADEPAAALLEIETFVNGIYRGFAAFSELETRMKSLDGDFVPLVRPKPEIEAQVRAALPFASAIRERLGWRVREFDLKLLGFIRRSSALSAVLGAGASIGAGAPSWAKLVKLLLEETLNKGLELREPVPAAGDPAQPPLGGGPSLRPGETQSWRVEYRVREVRRYTSEQEAGARKVLADIQAEGNTTDVETLKTGAQICYDLCEQELFQLLTAAIYRRAKAPSETHRAIARLAHAQAVPVRGPGQFPGWDSIITYNFDALMSEALAAEKVPHAVYGMRGDDLACRPDALAQGSDWHQRIYHLHGYTPRDLFRITDIPYVFSTSQFLAIRTGPAATILRHVFERYVANPVHIALYIGCSFLDEAMNDLLREAYQRFPGRYHYALLKWPHDRKGAEPSGEEISAASAKYLEFGVRPVWFDSFDDLPGLIAELQ